ncbi:unnamed protein product, partial [Ectocarpus sp. 12 AP-2014]
QLVREKGCLRRFISLLCEIYHPHEQKIMVGKFACWSRNGMAVPLHMVWPRENMADHRTLFSPRPASMDPVLLTRWERCASPLYQMSLIHKRNNALHSPPAAQHRQWRALN